MLVHIRQRRPECLQDHLPVLLANNFVPCPASRVDVLLPDGSDLCNDLLGLRLQNALEHADGIVDEVRHCLLNCTLRSHVDGLDYELLRVLTLRPALDFCDHISNLLLREKGQGSHEPDRQNECIAVRHIEGFECGSVSTIPLATVDEHLDDPADALLFFDVEVLDDNLLVFPEDLLPHF